MGATSIEWAEHSINPIRAERWEQIINGTVSVSRTGHYCEKISPGCANCYASTLQKRFQMPPFPGSRRDNPGVRPYLDEDKLAEVLRRKKPTRYFWCDMTDMFGWWVSDEWLDKIFATMACTPQHTHLVLTKRPGRMRDYLARTGKSIAYLDDAARMMGYSLRWSPQISAKPIGLVGWPIPNIWLGVSAEDQKRADERIPILAQCPAAVRFVSAEPLLGPIDFTRWLATCPCGAGFFRAPEMHCRGCNGRPCINWGIVGGESGANARRCDIGHVRSIVDQCRSAGVACFVKQLGARPIDDSPYNLRLDGISDRKGGDPAEWPEDLRVREFPNRRF